MLNIMAYLTSQEIFDQYLIKKMDKFLLTLHYNLPSLSNLSLDIKTDIFKIYFDYDCEFSYYYWLDTAKLLKDKGEFALVHEIAEYIVTYHSSFNYGILFLINRIYYLYLSVDESGSLYEFASFNEYKEFKAQQGGVSIYYEL